MSGRARLARSAARLGGALLLAALAGCAQMVPQTIALRTDWPQGVPQSSGIGNVPFFPQKEYECGPAALATVLAYSGVPVTPDPLVSQVYLPSRQGSLQLEMLATPRRYDRVSYPLAPRYADLLREVAAGNPVVVLQDVGPLFTQWHYAVVNGFDYPSGTLFLRSGKLARQEMPFTYFERTWIKGGYWAMLVMPPDRIPVTATEERWMAAVLAMARVSKGDAAAKAYAAALKRWPDNLAAESFPIQMVERHRQELVRARVFTSDQWGDYLIYRSSPEQKVFVDGRGDFYGEKLARDYCDLLNAPYTWRQLTKKYGFTAFLVERKSPLASVLRQAPEWRLADEDAKALLFLPRK